MCDNLQCHATSLPQSASMLPDCLLSFRVQKSQSFPPTFLFHIFTIRACVSIPFWTCRRSPQWLVYKLTASPWGKTASKCNKKSVWMVMNAWYSHLCPKSILVSESVLVFWSCNCRFWKINIDLGFSFLLLEVYVCLDECNVCLSLSLSPPLIYLVHFAQRGCAMLRWGLGSASAGICWGSNWRSPKFWTVKTCANMYKRW